MSLFLCAQCGCIANTATDEYWRQMIAAKEAGTTLAPRCCVCDPGNLENGGRGVWHGCFERRVPHPDAVKPNVLGGHYVDIVSQEHDEARCMCTSCTATPA